MGRRKEPIQDHYKFADLEWQSRWNAAHAPHLMYHQAGPDVTATGMMGVLRFDLRNDEDVKAIVEQSRGFADMIEKLKVEYDEGQKRWSSTK